MEEERKKDNGWREVREEGERAGDGRRRGRRDEK